MPDIENAPLIITMMIYENHVEMVIRTQCGISVLRRIVESMDEIFEYGRLNAESKLKDKIIAEFAKQNDSSDIIGL